MAPRRDGLSHEEKVLAWGMVALGVLMVVLSVALEGLAAASGG